MIDYNQIKDEDLINNIQNNKYTDRCLNVLIDRHSGICIDMINSYMSSGYNISLRQELIDDKDYQIYESALKFDPHRGTKFSTYLGNEIKWRCLNIYNKSKRHKHIPVEENLINYFSYLSRDNECNESEKFNEVIKKAQSYSDKRIGKIFHLRYVIGKNNSVMPWKNISSQLNMSIQGCINIHNSFIENFKKQKNIN
jgi:DNA-directed RNA polymerase sigma subunit (sigma70/sigma32)